MDHCKFLVQICAILMLTRLFRVECWLEAYDNDSIDIAGHLTWTYLNSMLVTETEPNEIKNIVDILKARSSKGYDDISSRVVKDAIDEISTPLTTFFNKSLLNGIFPDKLKIAKLIPIFKSVDILLINNYRPIAGLPFFSKLLKTNVQ